MSLIKTAGPRGLLTQLSGKTFHSLFDAPRNLLTSLSDKARTSPAFESKLRSVFDFNVTNPKNKKLIQDFTQTAGRNTGTVLGGATMGVINPDVTNLKNDTGEGSYTGRLLNILGGAIGGGLMGRSAGKRLGAVLPELAQKSFGRVATNLYAPWMYDLNASKDFAMSALDQSGKKVNPLMAAIKAVVTDKPLYGTPGPEDLGREFFYRRMYGLKPRFGAEDFFVPAKGKRQGTWNYNMSNPAAKNEYERDIVNAWASLAPGDMRPTVRSYEDNLAGLINNKGYVGHGTTPGGFYVRQNGRWLDDWDFKLRSTEKYDSPNNLARGFADMLSKPERLIGTAPSPRDIVKHMPAGVGTSKVVQNIVNTELGKRVGNNLNYSNSETDNLIKLLADLDMKKKQGLITGYMDNPKFDAVSHITNLLKTDKGTLKSVVQ